MSTPQAQRAAEHLRILLDHLCRAGPDASFEPLFARHAAALSTADIEAIHQQAQAANFRDLGFEVSAADLDMLRHRLADELGSRKGADASAAPAITIEAYEEVREAHEPSNNGNF